MEYFSKVINGTTRPVATVLASQKTVGATSATVQATTGWETSTPVHGILYRTNAGTGLKIPGSQIDFKATVTGTTLSNFQVTAGTDDTYAIGSTVELAPTAAWGDDIATGILVQHNQDGSHKSVTTDTLVVTGGTTLPAGDITTNDLADSSVTSAKLAPSKSTDANGWTVYDFGTFKQYRKRITYAQTFTAGSATAFALSSATLPVGMATLGTNFIHATLSQAGSAFMHQWNFEMDTTSGALSATTVPTSSGSFSGRIDVLIASS